MRLAFKGIFLLQRAMMAEIAALLFKGYGLMRRKVSASASTSVLTLCIVMVRFPWTNVTFSAAASAESGGLVSSSGRAFMLYCSKGGAQKRDS